MLGRLEEVLSTPATIRLFETEFRRAYEAELAGDGREKSIDALRSELQKQESVQGRLLDALEAGESEGVRARLQTSEKKLRELAERLQAAKSARPTMPLPEVAVQHVRLMLAQYPRLLTADAKIGQKLLRDLFGGELLLVPIQRPAGKDETRSTFAYEVSGSLLLQGLLIPVGTKDGLSVVAGARYAGWMLMGLPCR